jgi:uncharacterized protein (DUF2252 family)
MSAGTEEQMADTFAAAVAPVAPVAHLTVAEREARGKAARAEVPRASHADWQASPARPDPVALLEEQAKTRLAQLVPIRYGRMLVSPFAFYRGAAAIMASDLAGMPRSGLHVQLCGDAHLANFGAYAAPDRRLVFDTNDFDETLPGPFEWDLRRLVASFAVAGRERGYDSKKRRAISCLVSRTYREAMAKLAGERNLDIWYTRTDVEEIISSWSAKLSTKALKRAEQNIAKARTRDSLTAFAKLTRIVDGEPQIVAHPPLIIPVRDLATGEQIQTSMQNIIRSYRRTLTGDRRHLLEQFRFVDAAIKVVGVGSVGTRSWIGLFMGRDNDDPLLLQVKEADASVLEPYLGKSRYASHGQRVVEGQRLMQAASDMMLGWIGVEGLDGVKRDFYVRQLWDSKGSALVDVMTPRTMEAYASICGRALARAHARSGDAIAIASYLGGSDVFDTALATFAETYADQNQRDYDALAAAAASGRIVVQRGV